MSILKRGWKGEVKLWKIFWLWGVLAQLILGVVLGLFVAINPLLIFVIGAVYIVYSIWWLVATWRCAFNCSWKGWGYIARVVCILSILLTVAPFFKPFVSSDSDGEMPAASVPATSAPSVTQ